MCPLKSGPLLLLSLPSLESINLLSEAGEASRASSTLNYHVTTCHCQPSGLYLAQDGSQLINKQIRSEASEGGGWRAEVSGFSGVGGWGMPLIFSSDPLVYQMVKILGQLPMRGAIWCSEHMLANYY